MHRLFVSMLLFGLAGYAAATTFTDCGSSSSKTVKSVTVSDCPDGQDVCILKRGGEPEFEIKFVSQTDTDKVKAVVHGVIAGVPIPFPIPQSDGCKSGINCPVKAGQSCTYGNKFNVRQSYPVVAVTVRYELKGKNNEDMVCIEIPCQIQ